jgi:hypothetical protein
MLQQPIAPRRGRKMTMTRSIIAALGVAAMTGWGLPAHADVNLVGNGNFGTGDFTDWTVDDPNNSPTFGPGVGIQIDTSDPFTGDTDDAFLGTEGTTGTLSQSLATSNGTTYTISFELADPGNPFVFTESLVVNFGSDAFLIDPTTLSSGYTLETFTGAATSGSTNLVFTEENDDSDFQLDDVSVTAQAAVGVPEPSSTMLLVTGLAAFAAFRRRRRS